MMYNRRQREYRSRAQIGKGPDENSAF